MDGGKFKTNYQSQAKDRMKEYGGGRHIGLITAKNRPVIMNIPHLFECTFTSNCRPKDFKAKDANRNCEEFFILIMIVAEIVAFIE